MVSDEMGEKTCIFVWDFRYLLFSQKNNKALFLQTFPTLSFQLDDNLCGLSIKNIG